MRKSTGKARRSIHATGTIRRLQPNTDTAASVQQRQLIRRAGLHMCGPWCGRWSAQDDEMVSARCRDGRRLMRRASGRACVGKQRGRQRMQGSAVRGSGDLAPRRSSGQARWARARHYEACMHASACQPPQNSHPASAREFARARLPGGGSMMVPWWCHDAPSWLHHGSIMDWQFI